MLVNRSGTKHEIYLINIYMFLFINIFIIHGLLNCAFVGNAYQNFGAFLIAGYLLIFLIIHCLLNCVFVGYAYEILGLF